MAVDRRRPTGCAGFIRREAATLPGTPDSSRSTDRATSVTCQPPRGAQTAAALAGRGSCATKVLDLHQTHSARGHKPTIGPCRCGGDGIASCAYRLIGDLRGLSVATFGLSWSMDWLQRAYFRSSALWDRLMFLIL